MNRSILIIAIASIGLNLGLGAAVGLSLFQRNERARAHDFDTFASGGGFGGGDGKGGRGQHNDDENRYQTLGQPLSADCIALFEQGAEFTDPQRCGLVAFRLAQAVPKNADGTRSLPRHNDGDVNWRELGRIIGSPAAPPRPNSMRELQRDLALSDPQSSAFRRLLQDQRPNRRALNQDLVSRRATLSTVLQASPFDLDQALEAYKATLDVRNDALVNRATLALQFMATLDDDQRAILNAWTNNNPLRLLE